MDVRLITKGLETPWRVEVDEESRTPTFGRFSVRPLEKGFGHTLGNALRRVLLSAIPGAAVTAVRIEGVPHEFSVIPGVIEDVAEIVLNLKSLRFRIKGSGVRQVHLSATGNGKVKASQLALPDDVEIMNPDQVIATIEQPDASLEMDLTVRTGRGFVPAEEHSVEKEIGVIPIDALFSPVRRVSYRVEPTRVRQRTDYDKLIIEVQTDGIVDPEDAIGYAARILTDYLRIFITFEESGAEEETEESKEDERMRKLLATPVEELELSVRSSNCLKAANLKTLGELVIRTDQEMLKYRNFGKKSLQEIKEKLQEYGLTLGMKDKIHLTGSREA